MPFQFRFSTILAVRERQRDDAAAAVATVQAQLQELDTARRRIALDRQASRDSILQQRRGIISAQSLRSQHDYLAALQHQDDTLADQQSQTALRLEQTKSELIRQHREVSQLEKLLQREQLQHQTELKRTEQREHDQIATARYHHRRK